MSETTIKYQFMLTVWSLCQFLREKLLDLVLFRVVKVRNGFGIMHHSGAMSVGGPNYKEELGIKSIQLGNFNEEAVRKA